MGRSLGVADETTARAAGSLTYLHVACTRFLTAMHVGDRSKDTIDAAGIWPAFTGVLVRDGYAGYEHLDTIEHAWCGIHLVRDLRAVHDPDPIHPGRAPIRFHPLPRLHQDVTPVDPVIQGVETPTRRLLGRSP